MKKSILAIAMAVAMLLSFAIPVLAAEGATDELVIDAFLGGYSANYAALKDGETATISFFNKSTGNDAWNNFVLAVCNGTGADKGILSVIRADNWVLGYGNFPDGNSNGSTNGFDFADFVEDAKNGFKVDLTVTRNGDSLVYKAVMAEKYIVEINTTSANPLPETVYLFLSGDHCTLSDMSFAVRGSAPITYTEVTDLGYVIATTFFGAKSGSYALKDGSGLTFKFKNKSYGTVNWENFVLAVVGENHVDAAQEALVIRADAYGWGGGLSDIVAPGAAGNALAFNSDIDWSKWMDAMKAGVDVTLSIGRRGNTLIYSAQIGEWTVSATATSGKALPENLYVFLTGENCSLYTAQEPVRPTQVPPPTVTPAAPALPPVETSPKIEGDLTVTGFFTNKTDAVTLQDGENYTFNFTNKSNGSNNWENYILAVTGAIGEAYTGATEEVLIVRADAWGWGGGKSDFVAPDAASGNKLVFETNIADADAWNAWARAMRIGAEVTVKLSRSGNTLTYEATTGEYTIKLTAKSGKALPKVLYVFFTGENCALTGITTETNATPAKPDDTPATDPETPAEVTPEIKGDLTVTTFFNEKTNAVPLKTGEYYTFTFNNKSAGTNNWENFVLAVAGATGAAYTGAAEEVLIIRADAYGWGGGMSDLVAPDAAEGDNKLAFETNIADADAWAAWAKAMQDGVAVTAKIARDGDTLTYEATMGEYTIKLTAKSGKALPETLYVFFTGENCALTGIATETNAKAPAETDPSKPSEEETKPSQPTVSNPKIEGTLNVTTFFNEKTSAVPLKSGDSYTFSFTNKSKGTNNWENFILAVAGATGAAYTGADQEILIIRADNWGWGGGMSDFVAPDAASGNKLVFESNINWDTWVAENQAGMPVTITISRRGNTLTYNATIGSYYVKLTATSGKALPETAYVFFTGENCTLGNIRTVASVVDGVAQTGDTTNIGWWIALMVLSALGLAAVSVKALPILLKKH